MELAMADVHGVDMRGAVFQQHLGEAACGGAHIQTDKA